MAMRPSIGRDTRGQTVPRLSAKEKRIPLPTEVATRMWEKIERLRRHRMKKLRELQVDLTRDGIKEVTKAEKEIVRQENELEKLRRAASNLQRRQQPIAVSLHPKRSEGPKSVPRSNNKGFYTWLEWYELQPTLDTLKFSHENRFSPLLKLNQPPANIPTKRASRKVRKKRRQQISEGKTVKTFRRKFEQWMPSEPTRRQYAETERPVTSSGGQPSAAPEPPATSFCLPPSFALEPPAMSFRSSPSFALEPPATRHEGRPSAAPEFLLMSNLQQTEALLLELQTWAHRLHHLLRDDGPDAYKPTGVHGSQMVRPLTRAPKVDNNDEVGVPGSLHFHGNELVPAKFLKLRLQVVEKYECEHRQVADKTHVSDAVEFKGNTNATSAIFWEQSEQFGRADLNSWKERAGRGKSWRRLRTNRRAGSSKAIHVPGLGRSGILQIQVVRSQLPVTLLKATPVTIVTTFSNFRTKRKAKTRLDESADEEKEHYAKYGSAFIDTKAAEPLPTSNHAPLRRFLFRGKTGKRLVQDRFYDIFAVEDLNRQHFHLVGLMSTEEDYYPSVGFVVNNFHIRVIAMSYGVFDGLWRFIAVGKQLEEPSPFSRYTFGTLDDRVRRYCNDFPKPGKQPGSVTGLRSDPRPRTTIEREELFSGKNCAPETAMETRPQAACAEVPQVPTAAIGRDASSLSPGGDSFTAVSLVTEALSNGLIVMAKDTFSDPSSARLKEKERKNRRQGKQRRKRARKRAERHEWKAVIADVEYHLE